MALCKQSGHLVSASGGAAGTMPDGPVDYKADIRCRHLVVDMDDVEVPLGRHTEVHTMVRQWWMALITTGRSFGDGI